MRVCRYNYKVYNMSTYKPSHDSINTGGFEHGNTTILNRHGITIIAQCVGTFGEFDFLAFFTMLASASAMMAIASLIVDRCSVWLFPLKKYYKTAKYVRPPCHHEQHNPTSPVH